MAGEIHIHIKVFAVDLLLKGDEHLAGQLLQLKAGFLFLGDVLVLEPGDVQHTADQAA